MSSSNLKSGARKRLIWLALAIVALAGIIGGNQLAGTQGASLVPQLALDLQGGTQMILSPVYDKGVVVDAEKVTQAVDIIRQRIDSTGVSEAQITTQGEGANAAIVVSVPGNTTQELQDLISQSAKMNFRPVLLASGGSTASVGADGKSTNPPVASAAPTPGNHSDINQVTPAIQQEYDALVCNNDFKPATVADSALLVTCSNDNAEKYVLGPVDVPGTEIKDAAANTETTSQGVSLGSWLVNLTFKSEGAKLFEESTKRLNPLSAPFNRFAVTLDGLVVTAPTVQAVIAGGSAQITGSYTQDSATSLANRLKYGSLPVQFEVKSSEKISATLGVQSLQSGLLAGLIGLILVVIYSLFQYRALSILTIGSLAIAATITYLTIDYLSWRQGYRLSLSGIAGLIVAIGITADSFIVYFERVRDELRDGRPLSAAVEAGWKRAWRTILVSDGVSLLAAVTLYLLTVGNVRGFAFTLGLTTLIDLAVVILFTHPVLQLLSGLKFFLSGHKFSGFNLASGGTASYTGRGTFRAPADTARAKKSSKEVAKRQTIAERKAQEGTK